MPSSSEGRRYCTETGPSGAFSGSFHPAMWSYGMMPWQQPPVQAQPYPYPMHPVPYPVVMNPRMNSVTAPWFHANDNYTSLPPKPKLETEDLKPFAQVKPARRFSDPGPVENCDDSPSPVDDKPASDHEDELEPSETQLFAGTNLNVFVKSYVLLINLFSNLTNYKRFTLLNQKKRVRTNSLRIYCKSCARHGT